MPSIVQQLQSCRNYALIDCKDVPPFQALARISKLFESNPELVDRVNALTPEGKCMNVKTAALNQTRNKNVDLKIPFDMSPDRLDALGKELRAELGDDFDTVMSFFTEHLQKVSDLVSEELAGFCGKKSCELKGTYNYRMCDYFPITEKMAGPRCGKHRDYGSFTLIVADKPGLEVWNPVEGKWVDVFLNEDLNTPKIIVIGGYVLEILSQGKITASLHRVVNNFNSDRRLSFCHFVAPTKESIVASGMTVQDLKSALRAKWKHREGNIGQGDVYDETSQDNIVKAVVEKQRAMAIEREQCANKVMAN